MNITTEQTHSSLAQRIEKVRNCMLVELSTGVSATDEDLSGQYRVGFSVIRWPHLMNGDDDWDDWNDKP